MTEENELDTVNRQVARVPVLFLIDVSGAKRRRIETEDGNRRRVIDLLNEGLEIFTEQVSEDLLAHESVDVSLVTFGGRVKTEQDFRPIKETWIESSPPTFSARGSTPMCKAIIKGIKKLEEYEHYLHGTELAYRLPLIWLITDGRPDQSSGEIWQEAQKAIGEGFCDHSKFFFAVGLGENADEEILNNIVSKAGDDFVEVLQLEESLSMDAFRIAADCVKARSHKGYSTATEILFSEAVDLKGVNLYKASLSEADLSGKDLSNADLTNADLSGADLSGADLSDANFTHADLSEADFRAADLEGATMDGEEIGLRDIEEAGGITERTSNDDN
ncbi:pentapeptide repeat-containing protein [Haloplanus salilacus]|uniref:pentapeptide repeat-containing protein n=1 Tax=Haloplanus salilacus TaxID=2949994 RepID=UPI0030D40108